MAIDVEAETLVPIGAVPGLVPGRRVNLSTVWRWCLKGVRGRRLESVAVGGRRYTSREALTRFFAPSPADPGNDAPAIRTPARRQRDHARAVEALDAAGW